MAGSDAAAYVRLAMERAAGDRTRAQALLLDWAARDERVLRALTGPYLVGIVARAIDRQQGRPPPRSRTAGAPAQAAALSADAFEQVVGQLGRRIGTVVEPEGLTALVTPPAPRSAGRGHAETLRRLASAYRRADPPARRGESPPDTAPADGGAAPRRP